MFIKANGKMEKLMDKVFSLINQILARVYLFTKDSLKTINNMDMDKSNGMVKRPFTLEIFKMAKKQEEVNLYLTAMYMMVIS